MAQPKSFLLISIVITINLSLIPFSSSSVNNDAKKIPVVVKNATILNPFRGLDLMDKHWPILYVEFDIGHVCLQSKALKRDGSNFSLELRYNANGNPECKLLCGGPEGPIQVWRRATVLKSLSECISSGLSSQAKNENKEMDCTTLSNTTTIIIGSNSSMTSDLDLSDPDKKLDAVLTLDELLEPRFLSKSTDESGIYLKSGFMYPEPVTICLINSNFSRDNKDFIFNSPAKRKECTTTCIETFEKSPLQLSIQEVEESFWACIGTTVYTNVMDTGFYITKEPFSGLVVIEMLEKSQDSGENVEYKNEL